MENEEKGIRKGVNKEDIMKSAKENGELQKFVQSLTKDEMHRIKAARQFDTITAGTPTYKIAILSDPLRQSMRALKLKIANKLNVIGELTNNILRLKVQSTSGIISEELRSGMLMNETEIESLIQKNKCIKGGEFASIYVPIGNMRSIVGQPDYAGTIIMSVEEFDLYVLDIETSLKKYGFNLFGELE